MSSAIIWAILRESLESERTSPPVAPASSARRVLGLAMALCSAVSKAIACSRVTACDPSPEVTSLDACAARASICAASRVRSEASSPVASTP